MHPEVTLAEAALRLGLSWQQAWRLVLVGALKGRKVGRRWFVGVESIERYASSTRTIELPK